MRDTDLLNVLGLGSGVPIPSVDAGLLHALLEEGHRDLCLNNINNINKHNNNNNNNNKHNKHNNSNNNNNNNNNEIQCYC